MKLFDLIMIFCTGGLWIIWMIVRGSRDRMKTNKDIRKTNKHIRKSK